MLSDEEWDRRHRAIVAILWVHCVGLGAFAVYRGYGIVHSLPEVGVLVALTLIAATRRRRGFRTLAASFGLLTSSALLVHLSGGMIEAHFHFFVVVGLLTLYQDWSPFLVAIGFVVLHHMVLGALAPTAVFSHPGAWRSPWKWALIHGVFVLASSSAYIVAWRVNERSRALAEESFRKLRSSEERFRSMVQNALDAIVVLDEDLYFRYQSPAVRRVIGYAPEDLADTQGLSLVHPDDEERARRAVEDMLAEPGASIALEVRCRHKNGTYRWLDARASNLLEDPNVCGIVVNFRDVSERKALEQKLTQQAFYDALTGLANRILLSDRIASALQRSSRHGRPVSLLYVDLDGFKLVNDTLGHEAGDALLKEMSQRLCEGLREVDTPARLGGDEFAVLLDEADREGAELVARRIVSSLTEPVAIFGNAVRVGCSVGLYVADDPSELPGDLLRKADVAMYVAKRDGKGCYKVFEPHMFSTATDVLRLKEDLRRAIASEEFRIVYQPLFALDNTRLTGFEALIRWEHPTRGLMSPVEFIPLAEETGMIVEIGEHIMRMACRNASTWRGRYGGTWRIAVNLSALELGSDRFVEQVQRCIADFKLKPGQLVLEITESLLLRNVDETVARLGALREHGVRVAIDDFGTGQSSLGLLRQLPADVLKIDKIFIDQIASGDSRDVAFVEAIIQLAKTLSLEVVAEGVETEEQGRVLRSLGCQTVQGYLYGRPVDAESAEELLNRHAHKDVDLRRVIRLPETGRVAGAVDG